MMPGPRPLAILLATLLGVVALPCYSHDPTRGVMDSAVGQRAEPAEARGVVRAYVVDNATRGSSHRYVDLELDDGSDMPLEGSTAAALPTGERVRASGRRNGKALEVDSVERLAAPGAQVAKASVEVEGTLAVLHADDFAAGTSRFIFEVHDDAGRTRTIRLGSLPRELVPGMRVRVQGRASATTNDMIDPERIVVLAQPSGATMSQTPIAKAATANSVLVVMANFSNTVAPGFTVAQAQQVMTSNADSVANFFREASYGQQLMNVTVTPNWLRMNLAQPTSCGSSDWQAIGTSADAAARTLGAAYDPSNYNFVVYVFPTVTSCGWLGLGYIGNPHKAWINGTQAFHTAAIAHEMGHNFGLLHAASLRCAGSIGGSCTVSEYGDPFDTMGNRSAMHYNAAQKAKLRWIPSSSVITHAGGAATYTLSPIEAPGGTTYAVKIPTSSTNRTYWLEFRQPIGFDAGLSSVPNNGAQIRVASPFETMCRGCDGWSDDTELLDMTPATSSFSDAALVVGRTFSDPTYGVNVSVLSASPSALTLQVSTGGATIARTSTTTSIISSANPSIAQATTAFTATVSGSNPSGSVTFTDTGSVIAGCSAIALTGSGNLRTARCTTTSLLAGNHSIVANYSGDVANLASKSSALAQIVEASLLDHYYESILGRAADASGRAFWQGQVNLMQSLGIDVTEAYRVMAMQFFNSREYLSFGRSDTGYVTDLYDTFLDRAPDAAGLAYWLDQLRSGAPRNVILYSFMFAPEFTSFMTATVGARPARAEVYVVVDLYRGLLARLPDAAGFDYWTGRLRAAECSAQPASSIYAAVDSISRSFLLSNEYVNLGHGTVDYVSDLYNAFLRRGGAASEVAFWTDRLNRGVETRDQVRTEFMRSMEFSARLNAMIEQGCA
jgi:hypothetical protein